MKNSVSKFISALIETLIAGVILIVLFLAFTSCSPDPSSDPSSDTPERTLTIESYDYVQYNYVAGLGKQYEVSAVLDNQTTQTKSGVIIFDFTADGTRPNDISLPYSIGPGATLNFTTASPVYISTGASLESVYIQ